MAAKLVPSTIERIVVHQPGLKLIELLTQHWPHGSASFWREQIDQQMIWINDHPARLANRELKVYDCILYAKRHVQPWQMIEETEDLIVLNKPANCDVKEAELFLKKSNQSAFFVHRLDKMTTGAYLMAKNLNSQNLLEAAFYQQMIKKDYLAIVWGRPQQASGLIRAKLSKATNAHGGAKMRIVGSRPLKQADDNTHALSATTKWRLLAHAQGLSVLHCQPLTGRTHQIRAHLSHLGHPIIGDRDYLPHPRQCSHDLWKGNLFFSQHLLHAYSLHMHQSPKKASFTAALSAEFERALTLISPKLLKFCQKMGRLDDFY